jgi:hypothetical protein
LIITGIWILEKSPTFFIYTLKKLYKTRKTKALNAKSVVYCGKKVREAKDGRVYKSG